MKFPSISYFAGPLLGYSAKFTFKRSASPFNVYFHCDDELALRISMFGTILTLDISDSVKQRKRDDVYFD